MMVMMMGMVGDFLSIASLFFGLPCVNSLSGWTNRILLRKRLIQRLEPRWYDHE